MSKIQTKVYIDGHEVTCPRCGGVMNKFIGESSEKEVYIILCDSCMKLFNADETGSFVIY